MGLHRGEWEQEVGELVVNANKTRRIMALMLIIRRMVGYVFTLYAKRDAISGQWRMRSFTMKRSQDEVGNR
jgi:hypothetical protein